METVAGVKVTTPLVLWAGLSSDGVYDRGLSVYTTYTRLAARLFFGDGDLEGIDPVPPDQPVPIWTPQTFVHFVPLDVDGRGVSVDDTGTAIFAARGAEDTAIWRKNYFIFYPEQGNGTGVPEPPPISPPPQVRLKRYYFPDELTLFQLLGVQPPDDGSVIFLR